MNVNTLSIDANLIDAVEAIESTVKRLAVVVSQNNDVLGTLTDGDVRRHFCMVVPPYAVADAMNKQPIIAAVDKSDDFVIKL